MLTLVFPVAAFLQRSVEPTSVFNRNPNPDPNSECFFFYWLAGADGDLPDGAFQHGEALRTATACRAGTLEHPSANPTAVPQRSPVGPSK